MSVLLKITAQWQVMSPYPAVSQAHGQLENNGNSGLAMLTAARLLEPPTGYLLRNLGLFTARLHLGSQSAGQDPVQEANQEINQAFGLVHDGPSSSSSSSRQPASARDWPPMPEDAPRLTHVDAQGQASMVDVSKKAETVRSAEASCVVKLGPVAFPLVQRHTATKGNVLATAQLAGIQAAKQTSHLIPLCHNILLTKVHVQLSLQPQEHSVHIAARVHTVGRTGVEMEALTAASVAALTVYDMCKAASKDIEITALRLDAKSGGHSGDYRRQ